MFKKCNHEYMKTKEFEDWFWGVIDGDLHRSLETWQVERIKTMCKKAIKKGKK